MNASAADKEMLSDSEPLSVASFATLPVEIRARIISLACNAPEHTSSSIDRETTLSLMFVSSATYQLAAAVLYRNIVVPRPSILAELAHTLVSKPALGLLIKSLHLGPTGHLSCSWWPISGGRIPPPEIQHSLEDQSVLPPWCRPGTIWVLHGHDISTVSSHRDRAVLLAISAAQAAIGVNIKTPSHAFNGRKIDPCRWLAGVLEVQAAFELYLMQLRRLEDAAGLCPSRWSWQEDEEDGISIVYPSLEIVARGARNASNPSWLEDDKQIVFRVHHADLVKHLRRRGAAMDHFDHPLVFARSALQLVDFDPRGHWRHNEALLNRLRGLDNDYGVEFLAHTFSLRAPPQVRGTEQPPMETLSTALFDTTTTGGILALARLVLTHAPRLEHLSLVSYLQLVLWRENGSVLVPSLRSLAFSLLSSLEDIALHLSPTLHGAHLTGLKRLYLSGHNLQEQKMVCIIEMPGLKEVTWDLCHSDYASPKELFETIISLQQVLNTKTTVSPRCVRILVARDSLREMLEMHSSPAERELWRSSQSICRRPHRLHVDAREPFVWQSFHRAHGPDVYSAKGDWWEKCITGVSGESGSESEGCSVTSEDDRGDRAA